MIQYLNGHPTFLTFDLFDDASPLIIEVEKSLYESTDFLAHPPVLTFRRPTDNGTRRLPIYISSSVPIRARAYINVLFTTVHGLLATNLTLQRPLSFAKRLHRFGHAPVSDMKRILSRAGYDDPKLDQAVEEIGNECLSCDRSGPPLPSKSYHSHGWKRGLMSSPKQTKALSTYEVENTASYMQSMHPRHNPRPQ